jgi:cytochrome b subunit of formate dehydrogenase
MATVTVANVERSDGGATLTSQVSASAKPQVITFKKPNLTFWLVVSSMLFVAVVAILMWLAYHDWITPMPKPIQFTAGYVPYAGVVAVTAALERFLEPLTYVLLPDSQIKQVAAASKSDAQKAAADPAQKSAAVQALVQTAADKQADADARRTQRSIIFWAIASSCGLILSGGFGLFLLQSVAKGHVNVFLDLIVTGLTIGAGTKPVHDLITGMQGKTAGSS